MITMLSNTACQIFVLSFFVPYPSKQHFVWPLHWCLLADICNHTWIPECGAEEDAPSVTRLFLDECDMYEYNCDNERDFEPINYSDCFTVGACPVPEPCPSIPPCPNHVLHKVGNKYKYIKAPYRRMGEFPRRSKGINLPRHMLSGKRRYTRRSTRHTHIPTKTTARKIITKTKTKATFTKIVLKKEEVVKNGRRMMKIVKKMIKQTVKKVTKETRDSDFLE